MSDAPTVDSPKAIMSPTTRSIIGILVLMLSIVVVLFSGTRGLNEREVSMLLETFKIYSAQEAEKNGKTATFTHGAITIEGWGYEKKASVADVSLELTEKGPIDSKKMSFSTQYITMGKDNSMYNRIFVQFPSPINVIRDSELAYIINSEQPITYSTHRTSEGGEQHLFHGVRLPEKLTVNSALVAGKDEEQKRMLISASKANNIWREVNMQTGQSSMTFELPELSISKDKRDVLSIANLTGTYTVDPTGEDDKKTGKLDLTMKDVVFGSKGSAPPISMVLQGTYSGTQIHMDYASLRPNFRNMQLTLSKAAMMGKNFSLVGVGDVSFAVDDPLPYGELDIEIANPDQLIADNMIPAALKSFLEAALKKASGTEEQFAQSISIPIKREKNGVLYLGGSTFEAITAAVLSDFLKSAAGGKNRPAEVASELPPLPEGAPGLEKLEDESAGDDVMMLNGTAAGSDLTAPLAED